MFLWRIELHRKRAAVPARPESRRSAAPLAGAICRSTAASLPRRVSGQASQRRNEPELAGVRQERSREASRPASPSCADKRRDRLPSSALRRPKHHNPGWRWNREQISTKMLRISSSCRLISSLSSNFRHDCAPLPQDPCRVFRVDVKAQHQLPKLAGSGGRAWAFPRLPPAVSEAPNATRLAW